MTWWKKKLNRIHICCSLAKMTWWKKKLNRIHICCSLAKMNWWKKKKKKKVNVIGLKLTGLVGTLFEFDGKY